MGSGGLFARRVAHLVCYYGTGSGSGICGNDDTAIVEAADDGGTGGCGLGERDALGVEGEVPVVVAEVEAGHRGDVVCLCRVSGCRNRKEGAVKRRGGCR
jgi:hypothetical protein